jgi:hypothetical protein
MKTFNPASRLPLGGWAFPGAASALMSSTLGFFLAAQAVEPIPTFYQEPGLSPHREVVDQHVSERIDPFTGKLQIHAVDLVIPGNGGLDIQVQRACLRR